MLKEPSALAEISSERAIPTSGATWGYAGLGDVDEDYQLVLARDEVCDRLAGMLLVSTAMHGRSPALSVPARRVESPNHRFVELHDEARDPLRRQVLASLDRRALHSPRAIERHGHGWFNAPRGQDGRGVG